MDNQPTNKEIQELKEDLKEINSKLFKMFGGPKSLDYRSQINQVINDLYWLQKENYAGGDTSILI